MSLQLEKMWGEKMEKPTIKSNVTLEGVHTHTHTHTHTQVVLVAI